MVTFTPQIALTLINLEITNLVDKLASDENKSPTDCLRKFFETYTCALLVDPDSYLCLESPSYIRDMLNAEEEGDWTRWQEV